jgi:hypothetical protein
MQEKATVYLSAVTGYYSTKSEAISVIEKARTNFRVISAWIDVYDEDGKETVYHECYVNSVGIVKKPAEGGAI